MNVISMNTETRNDGRDSH